MKSACIIILNFNNYEDTIECVESVKKINYDNYEIVIVDNNSTNNSVQELKKTLGESVIYIETGKNLGYAGGNNVGLKYALDKEFEYICVLNNDTIVKEDFLTKCIEFLDRNVDVAFVGPIVLEYNEDTVQSTGGKVVVEKGLTELQNCGKTISQIPEIVESDFISGSCIVARKEFIKEHGLIPENYFLFYEETEWCYRAKKKGYRNVCIRDTYIRHKGSASIKETEGLSGYLMARNRIVFTRRNIGGIGKYILFLLYLIFQTVYISLRDDIKKIKILKAYFDGVINRVSRKYPFVIIKND